MAAHRRSILHRFCFLFSPTQSKLLDLIPGPLIFKANALSFDPAEKYYRIVASASSSRLEAHTGLFRLLMKGVFDPYVL